MFCLLFRDKYNDMQSAMNSRIHINLNNRQQQNGELYIKQNRNTLNGRQNSHNSANITIV